MHTDYTKRKQLNQCSARDSVFSCTPQELEPTYILADCMSTSLEVFHPSPSCCPQTVLPPHLYLATSYHIKSLKFSTATLKAKTTHSKNFANEPTFSTATDTSMLYIYIHFHAHAVWLLLWYYRNGWLGIKHQVTYLPHFGFYFFIFFKPELFLHNFAHVCM